MLKEKKFRKGVTWNEAVPAIVVIVILLLLLIPFVTQTTFASSDTMKKWWEYWFGGGAATPKPTSYLEAAIVCSYYRCTEGCDSKQVKKIDMDFSGRGFNCTDFCKQGKNSEGKICDDNAMKNPISVTIGGKEDVSKQNLGFAVCITEQEKIDGAPAPDFVNIDKRGIDQSSKEQDYCRVEEHPIPGMKKVSIKGGTYYIWTHSRTFVGTWGQTVVWLERPTTISTSTTSTQTSTTSYTQPPNNPSE
jgi:hypothetical protein